MSQSQTPHPSFVFGLGLPFQAIGLIARHPTVLALAALPFALSVGLSFFLGGALSDLVTGQAMKLVEFVGFSPDGFLGTIVAFVAKILSYFGMAMLLPFVVILIAVPFNDFLAEAVETRADPPLAPAPAPDMAMRVQLILMDLWKTALALLITVPLLLVSFIPGMQLFTYPLMFLLYVFGTLSYPQTRRGENAGMGVKFIGRHLGASLGFGLVIGLLGIVPFIAHFAAPLAVIGGTLLYARAVAAGWPGERPAA